MPPTPTVNSESPRSPVSETPYTIPVDPSRQSLDAGLRLDAPELQYNPYFPSAVGDSRSSDSLASPSDLTGAVPGTAGVQAPQNTLPTTRTSAVQAPGQLASPGQLANPGELVAQPPGEPGTLPAPAELDGQELESLPTPLESGDAESITEKLDGEPVAEPAPLEAEVTHWYHYPGRWLRGWNSHAEFGLDGSTGNARTLAIQTGLETKRKTDLYTLALDLDYRQASNRSTTTEDNGRFNIDYDRMLLDSPWSGFGKFGMEWDKFKAFDLRINMNGGLGYHWVRRDDATLVTRFGAGASREIGAPDDDWIPEAVFGAEAERQLTSRQKLKGKVDYFPAWEDFSNFRLVSDVAWEILLDDADNLSLKLAATDRYDSTPQGAKKNDLYYSLLLLYKF